MYFTVGTYGTVDMSGEFLALDTGSGKVIVGTALRAQTPYGRASGIPPLATPSGFVSDNAWGWGGAFDFRMDRAEFKRAVDPGNLFGISNQAMTSDRERIVHE